MSNRDGRWTTEEHEAFLRGMAMYGRRWTKVADVVGTRTTVQVRSHAQKWEIKMAKEQKAKGGHSDRHPPADISQLPSINFNPALPQFNGKGGLEMDSQEFLRLSMSNLEELKKLPLSATTLQSMSLLSSLPGLTGGLDGLPNMVKLEESMMTDAPTTKQQHKRRGSSPDSHTHHSSRSEKASSKHSSRRKKGSRKAEDDDDHSVYSDTTIPSDKDFEKLAEHIVSNHGAVTEPPALDEFSTRLWDMTWDEDGADGDATSWPQHSSEASSQLTQSVHSSTSFVPLQPSFAFDNTYASPTLDPMDAQMDYPISLAPYEEGECELDLDTFGEDEFCFMSDTEP